MYIHKIIMLICFPLNFNALMINIVIPFLIFQSQFIEVYQKNISQKYVSHMLRPNNWNMHYSYFMNSNHVKNNAQKHEFIEECNCIFLATNVCGDMHRKYLSKQWHRGYSSLMISHEYFAPKLCWREIGNFYMHQIVRAK